ncbi:MAG: DUF971 domain-containing protein [Nitrospiria bacterium]
MPQESSVPVEIEKIGQEEIRIRWQDGHVSNYRNTTLREQCQCASCVDEWSGQKRIAPGQISKDIVSTEIKAVGHYAVSIHWSDGHDTGIYPFDQLRRICPCQECRASMA